MRAAAKAGVHVDFSIQIESNMDSGFRRNAELKVLRFLDVLDENKRCVYPRCAQTP
jgi:hypothetical protein